MKIFVFSDIHGNSHVLNDLRRAWIKLNPDLIIFLGDIFGYYYGQEKILEFFKEHKILCLLGNHDRMALHLLDKEHELEYISRKYGESYKYVFKMSDDDIAWLRSLRSSYQVRLGIYNCLFVHGDHIDNLNGRIYPDTPLQVDFENWDNLFCGHTHIPFIRKNDDKLIINVGSIGQPRNGDLAQAVLFNSDTGSIEFLNFNWYPDKLRKELELRGDANLAHNAILERKRY